MENIAKTCLIVNWVALVMVGLLFFVAASYGFADSVVVLGAVIMSLSPITMLNALKTNKTVWITFAFIAAGLNIFSSASNLSNVVLLVFLALNVFNVYVLFYTLKHPESRL